MKKLLFIFDQRPYQTEAAQELVDLAYAQAAFGHLVSLLFCQQGLACLAKADSTQQQPSICKQLKAWDIYEIEQLVALGKVDSTETDIDGIEWIDSAMLSEFIKQFDQVVTLA